MKYKHKETGIEVELMESNGISFYRPNIGLIVVSQQIPTWVVENGNDWGKVEDDPKYKMLGTNMAMRASDGVEFSLRETVRTFIGAYDEEEVVGQILSFEWLKLPNILTAQVGKYKIDLNRLEKSILVTGDGIPVFDPKQVVYYVNTQWGVSNMYSKDAAKFLPDNMKRVFSTKEARLEYMAMNKLILTLAEIEEPSTIMRSKWIEIKIKAKEKLKQNDSSL